MWISACEADKIEVGTCVRNTHGGNYGHLMSDGEGWLPPLTEGKVAAIEPCGGDQLFLVHVSFVVGGHDAEWTYDNGDLYDLEVWEKEMQDG